MILRIGGQINEKDIEVNTGFAIFFDEGLDFTATSVSAQDCASSDSDSSPTCFHKTVHYNTIFSTKIKTPETRSYDYWMQYPSITVGATITTSEFNFYIPVKYTSVQKRLFFVQLTYHYMFPTTLHTFKVYGNNEACSSAGVSWKSDYSMALTDMTATITFGDLTEQADSSCVISTSKFTNESAISPLVEFNPLEVESTITACTDDLLILNSASTTWNSHFILHSFEKFWSNDTFMWAYQNGADGYPSAKCTNMQITTTGASSKTSPYEGIGETPIANTGTLKISSWNWPWNYGSSATIGKIIRFLWSGSTGTLKAYKPVTAVSTAKSGCLVSSGSGIYLATTQQQKIQFAIYPTVSVKFTSQFPTIQVLNSYSFDPPMTLTTSKCQISFENVTCYVGISGSILTIILTTTSTNLPQTLNAGEWMFTIWVNGWTSTTLSISYQSSIYAYFDDLSSTGQLIKVEACDQKSQPWTQGPASEQGLTLDNPIFTQVEGIRDYFEFTFKTNTQFYDFGSFKIDLDFLAVSNQQSNSNLRCALYKNNEISHEFQTLTLSNLNSVLVQFREQDSLLVKDFGLQSYKFKCTGAKITSVGITSGAKIEISYYVGNKLICSGKTTDLNTSYSLKQITLELQYINITMTKGFDAVGQEANYTFHVTAYDPEQSSAGWSHPRILFQAGSTFFIEFARDIAPKFSKGGVISCSQDQIKLPCNIIGERRISFPTATGLNPENTYGYNFTIYGVSQPYSLTKYNTMYIGIAANSSDPSQMTYQTESIIDTLPTIATYYPLQINSFSVNSTQVRSTLIMQFELVIPKEAMIEGTAMFVQFGYEYYESFFNGFTPYCILYNVIDSNTQAPHNYAKNCSYIIENQVQIFLSNDTNNTAYRRYLLEIQGIPSPIYSTNANNIPLIYICTNATTPTIPVYKTNNCTTNDTASAYTLGNYTSNSTFVWADNSPKIYKGTYRSYISLSLASGKKFQSEISSLGFTTQTVYEQFSFYPSELKITTGQTKATWYVSPKEATTIGLYQLQFTANYSDQYLQIPPINLQVVEGQYKLTPNLKELDIPFDGYGFPIVFNFSECLPLSDLTMTGNIYAANKSQLSDYFQFENERQIISFNENNQIEQLVFRVRGIKQNTSNQSLIAYLNFTLSGTNKDSYNIDSYCIKIKITEFQNNIPIITFNNIVNSTIPGQQEFQVRCSELGIIYYIVSQDAEVVQNATFKTMQQSTLKQNIQETKLLSFQENPKRTIYGYKFVTLAQTINSIIITNKLQSEEEYYIKTICVNMFETNSEYVTRQFQQVSNGGNPVIIHLEFQSTLQEGTNQLTTLNQNQILEAVCLLSEITSRQKDTIWAPDGQMCSNASSSRLLLSTSIEVGDSSEEDANETQSYYFTAMPDYFVSSETIVDDISEIIEDDDFETLFKANTVTLSSLNLYTHSVITNTKLTPTIDVPYISCTESSISLSFTMGNTNGFIFAGLIPYNQSTILPTILELKQLSQTSYNFTSHLIQFFIKDEPTKITFSELSKNTSYQCYWIGTNENPLTFTYQTEIKTTLRIMTEGRTATNAGRQTLYAMMACFVLLLI